jgi:hypothetical protein
MKVKPKHMACISVGAFHLAVKQIGLLAIDTEDLVAISQVSLPTLLSLNLFRCKKKCKNIRFLLKSSQKSTRVETFFV